MRFRSVLTIVGVALIGAMPALASTIPYASPLKESFGIHLARLSEFDSYGHSHSVSHSDKSWNDGNGNEGSADGKDVARSNFLPTFVPVVTTVPESGSLSLLFIGLAGTGFMAFRRRKLPSNA